MLNAFHRHRIRRDVRRLEAVPTPVPDDTWGRPFDLDGVEALDQCDAYVVLVSDPQTGAIDSYGPMTGPAALVEAERRRRDLDRGDLADVGVDVVRHHHA